MPLRRPPRLAALLAVAALVAVAVPAAAQDVPPSPDRRVCTTLGCVVTKDQDGDGRADWANGAFSFMQLAYLNANLNRTNLSHQGGVTLEEYDALHVEELGGALGVDFAGFFNLTRADGEGWGFTDAELYAIVFWTDHESGEFETVREETVYVRDSDGDGRPDEVHPALLP